MTDLDRREKAWLIGLGTLALTLAGNGDQAVWVWLLELVVMAICLLNIIAPDKENP